MEIKLEKLRLPDDTMPVEAMINSRMDETEKFRIDLDRIETINLAGFNALVRLYMKYTRAGKDILYINCHSEIIRHFVDKTQFHHVFDTRTEKNAD